MFKHSVKVPRLYKVAAKVAKEVKGGVGSIKQLVYEHKSRHPNIKAIYALVTTLFQRSEEVENLLKRSQLLVKEPRSDAWLTKILIVELLWGKKCLPGNSKPEKTVLAYEQIFKAHMSDVVLASEETESDNKDDFKPRYVRVNTLKISLNEAVEGFRDEGWVLSKFLDKTDYNKFLEKITTLGEEEFLVDIHIPDLLVFPSRTQFYNHPAYKNGSILLQDKASCLPVHILGPPPGSVVLDMCAAPGMKTTQVAALMNNQGKVYAAERDPRRFEILNRIIESSGATCITTVNKDVLTCNQKDFPGVQYILVDPSCSGSGMVGRMEFEQANSNTRIAKLAGFQIKILRSALTRYSEAKRVVYSTCSVFPEENEDVVRQVLETNSTFKLVPATKFVNDTWKNFGSSEYGNLGSYCLYAKPNEDFTNGFFVAVFERLEEGEENQFFNTKIYNFKKHLQSQENRKRRQQQRQVVGGNINDVENSQNLRKYNENEDIKDVKDDMNVVEECDGIKDNDSTKKRKSMINDNSNSSVKVEDVAEDGNVSKRKKKKKSNIIGQSLEVSNDASTAVKIEEDEILNVDENNVNRKKKKKKKYDNADQPFETDKSDVILEAEKAEAEITDHDDTGKKKKKKYDGVQSLAVDNISSDAVKIEKGEIKMEYEDRNEKKDKSNIIDQFLEVSNDASNVVKVKEDEILNVGANNVNRKKKKKKKYDNVDQPFETDKSDVIVKIEESEANIDNVRKKKKTKYDSAQQSLAVDNTSSDAVKIEKSQIKMENEDVNKKLRKNKKKKKRKDLLEFTGDTVEYCDELRIKNENKKVKKKKQKI